MKLLFEQVSKRTSKLTTQTYSTSFSLGIRLFSRRFHDPIYGIYGFVRLADKIVDSFHAHNKEELLAEFRRDTKLAIERSISLNPVLNSFQVTVNKFNIEWELIDRFLKSMEMDLEKIEYNRMLFEDYILGSAEVVGLMCLRVFTDGDEARYQNLKPSAMSLGAAFQKINFLRDLHSDYKHLGRTYFPGLDLKNFNKSSKEEIEADIEKDFKDGLNGIRMLPKGCRFGVYVAYVYYYNLFKKIKRLQSNMLLEDNRVRVPNSKKYALIFSSYLRFKLDLM